ncbi:MAG: PIN domain-containing protein [Deltaproteobacteria bacterium]|nr:PIN domain-containing protein [Deltaproteobacteria bacterium]MBI4373934.1 PIN domain-containing protein [Deltaproteobacteria bacterium]
MFVVDTNILLYGAIKEFREHEKARQLIDEWRRSATAWHSTWGIFYEFLRVSTHLNVFEYPLSAAHSWDFLKVILSSPGFSLLSEHEDHAKILEESLVNEVSLKGNLWHDGHTATLMKEHGIREIVTSDTDFHKFNWIKVNNPFV